MPYRSTEKTRLKKDAKRTAMMQAAVRVFADKGYHAATVRDIVNEADVAIGTFYFYFPDKETLFVHLFEETAAFLLQAIEQAINSRPSLPAQLEAAIQAYINVAFYEPAVVQLLLVGGVGSVPSLAERRAEYREKLIRVWQRPSWPRWSKRKLSRKMCAEPPKRLSADLMRSSITCSPRPAPNARDNRPSAIWCNSVCGRPATSTLDSIL